MEIVGHMIGSAFLILIVAGIITTWFAVMWFIACYFISEIQRHRIMSYLILSPARDDLIQIMASVPFEIHAKTLFKFQNPYKLYDKAYMESLWRRIIT
jgi:hypothetical protein